VVAAEKLKRKAVLFCRALRPFPKFPHVLSVVHMCTHEDLMVRTIHGFQRHQKQYNSSAEFSTIILHVSVSLDWCSIGDGCH